MMISNELSSDVDAPVPGSVTVVVAAAVVAAIGNLLITLSKTRNFFKRFFGARKSFFVGQLIPLFWTSSDVSSEF